MNKDHYIDYSIREVTDEGLIFSKEAISGLEKLGAYYASLSKTESKSLKPWQVAFSVAGMALILTSCVSAAPGLADGDHQPTIVDLNGNGIADNLENIIPLGTATPEFGHVADQVLVQTYVSKELGVAALHLFNPDMTLFGFTLINDAKTSFDMTENDGATFTLSGNDFSQTNEYVPYEENGAKGYASEEVLKSTEMLQWLDGRKVDQAEQATLDSLVAMIKADSSLTSNVFMSTDMNLDSETGLLIDMGVTLTVKVGEREFVFTSALNPVEKDDIFAGYQIASIASNLDQIPNQSQVSFDLVPSDWVDMGDGRFVSPEFVELQSQIAASGERLTLTPDGTIQDGATVVPGLVVDKNGNGMMTLQVNGESVTLRVESLSFDDEKGVNVAGYTLDENGVWRVKVETVEVGGGLSVILGEKVEGGTLIDSFVANPSLTPEQQAEKLEQTDYTRVGYEQGDLLWIQSEDERTILVDVADHERIIAEVKRAKNAGGTTEVVWNWNEMIDTETGESILFNVARTWDMGANGLPVDNDSVLAFQRSIMRDEVHKFAKEKESYSFSSIGGMIVSSDGSEAVVDVFAVLDGSKDIRDETDGTLFFENDGVISSISVTNFKFTSLITD